MFFFECYFFFFDKCVINFDECTLVIKLTSTVRFVEMDKCLLIMV